jgi:hypothetical protein
VLKNLIEARKLTPRSVRDSAEQRSGRYSGVGNCTRAGKVVITLWADRCEHFGDIDAGAEEVSDREGGNGL